MPRLLMADDHAIARFAQDRGYECCNGDARKRRDVRLPQILQGKSP